VGATGGGGGVASHHHPSLTLAGISNEESRKSDPEISSIPYRVSTLDRRVKMKSSRPRSLDMSSTWSMDSRRGSSSGGHTSSSMGGSSASESGGSERPSPCVSRNASFQSTNSTGSHATSNLINGYHHHHHHHHDAAGNASSSGQAMPPVRVMPPLPKPPSKSEIPKMDAPKTVTTLMGGRGYINWRRTSLEKQRTAALAQINNHDAFLVIWETKI